MKETSENYSTSRQSWRPQTTNEQRPNTTSHSATRHDQARPPTNAQRTPFDRPGLRLTSLSALYQPAFKPYSFSYMYNTKYNADFEGRYAPPPLPDRVSTANYAPIKYKFGSSTYQQHFQQRQPFSTAFVIPYSRHRRNNPQPTMVNSYNYPDGIRWIWKPSTPTSENVSKAQSQPKTQDQPIRYHRWYSR
ncbi:unnamed protein product [Porites lobata]|uniref:Uncharacterized protein n=1 Tax=Porites lobata TaxID=104759 RepID=A0ABN8PUF5_9CNID|nr:unnamed protein product [Porites lobata]